ncbi:MAG: hypothetical protein ACLQVY_20425 [Limisphaerales bacterium]
MTDTRTDYRGVKMGTKPLFQDRVAAGPRTIRQAIEAAVQAIDDDSLQGLSPEESPPFAQARAMLASLTLCYARQIYRSTDAACVVARDLSFPCLYGGELPDACVLRRFRAENREAIQRCLTAALHFLVEQKVSSGVVTKVSAPQVAEEARRRVIIAMFEDSTEQDEDLAEASSA